MISALLPDFWPYIIAGLAALGGALGLRWLRRDAARDARRETALDAAERMARTRKRMDDAEAAFGDDPAVLRDSLRKRDPGTK